MEDSKVDAIDFLSHCEPSREAQIVWLPHVPRPLHCGIQDEGIKAVARAYSPHNCSLTSQDAPV